MSVRDTAGIRVPPPLIPAACLAIGWLAHRWFPINLPLGDWLPKAGAVFVLTGAMLQIWSLIEFYRWKTSPEPWRPTTHMITSGPYRRSRNPIYVGFVAIQLGVGLILGNAWIVVGLIPAGWALHHVVIVPEERYLDKKFGEAYRVYRRTVRRWL